MSTPKRVKVTGGYLNAKVPAGAIYVGRAFTRLPQSLFANPWCVKPPFHVDVRDDRWIVRHHRDMTRIGGGFDTRTSAQHAAVDLYRAHLDQRPDLRALIPERLAGRDLACFCWPEWPCHADVLLELVSGLGSEAGHV